MMGHGHCSSSASHSLGPGAAVIRRKRSPLPSSLRPCSHCSCRSGGGGGCDGDVSSWTCRRPLLLLGVSMVPMFPLNSVSAQTSLLRGRKGRRLPEEESGAPISPEGQMDAEKDAIMREPVDTEAASAITSPGTQSIVQSVEQIGVQEGETSEEAKLEEQKSKTSQLMQEAAFRESASSELQAGPQNSLSSLLNGLGIVGSGVLGALYATNRNEKAALESNIATMQTEVSEKEAAMASLKKNYERSLSTEREEHRQEVWKLREEETSLQKQLSSASRSLASTREELQKEKKVNEDLRGQVSHLESRIADVTKKKNLLEVDLKGKSETVDVLKDKISLLSTEIEEKDKHIGELSSSLSSRAEEYVHLSSAHDQTKERLAAASSTIEKLNTELSETKAQLSAKLSLLASLNDEMQFLHGAKRDADDKIRELMRDYKDLQASSEARADLDLKLQSQKDARIHQLEEKVLLAENEANEGRVAITELAKERDELKQMLEEKKQGMQELRDQLRHAEDSVSTLNSKVSNLSAELEESRKLYEELSLFVSKLQDEFQEERTSLSSNLEDARSASITLSQDLDSIKDVIMKSKEELEAVSDQLIASHRDREDLNKELQEVYKKLGSATTELQEEKKVVATLSRELDTLTKQAQQASELRRNLEGDLDEATKSLDEMNKSALLLSQELESSSARTSTLEAEKEMLLRALNQQKGVAKEAQDNMEDAQKLIARLGEERESWERRSRKLEEDLASAKGEILRLRRQVVASNPAAGARQQPMNNNSNTGSHQITSTTSNAGAVGSGTPFANRKNAGKKRTAGLKPADQQINLNEP